MKQRSPSGSNGVVVTRSSLRASVGRASVTGQRKDGRGYGHSLEFQLGDGLMLADGLTLAHALDSRSQHSSALKFSHRSAVPAVFLKRGREAPLRAASPGQVRLMKCLEIPTIV